jgi:hypothetical protein
MSGYRDRPDRATVGSVIGCIAGIAFFATVGMVAFFGLTWGCVPAHRVDGEPCSWWVTPVGLFGIAGATLAVYWLVSRLVDWLWNFRPKQ